MVNGTRWFAALVGLLIWGAGSIPALGVEQDRGTVVAHVTVRGHDVAVYQIGEEQAPNTPQGMDGFAEQVAPVLHAWTKVHGVEAIGNLCHNADGNRWGTVLLTVYAHTSSPRTNACPDGMTFTGVTIHSHPQRHVYAVNPVDRLFLVDGLMAESKIATYPDEYSADDLNAGPGYLVGLMALHFQDGQGHQRIVQRLP